MTVCKSACLFKSLADHSRMLAEYENWGKWVRWSESSASRLSSGVRMRGERRKHPPEISVRGHVKKKNKKQCSFRALVTQAHLLTFVRGGYCYALCCEFIIKVTRVCLWCDLGLEGWNKLRRRRIHFIFSTSTSISHIYFYSLRHGTFFSITSCQLIEMKNLWLITSLASSGPPPSL